MMMSQINNFRKEQISKRRKQTKQASPKATIEIKGNFLVIAQETNIILLTKKELFAAIPAIKKFLK